MATFIKHVCGRNLVEFDKGKFDAWCVFLTKPGHIRYAPRDTEYFGRLAHLARRHGNRRIYDDFVQFYTRTTHILDPAVLQLITGLAAGYGPDAEEIETWFTVIYAGMVAEENKASAILKKRIKRLGMHQLLLEGMAAADAAQFSRGKKWRELDALMREKGF